MQAKIAIHRESRALHSQKQRCCMYVCMEGYNVSNTGFLNGAWEEGFHPILSTIKTKQALKVSFELAYLRLR